jgi:hypothetical protein
VTTFVAALRLVCYVAREAVDAQISVRIIAAKNWDDARMRALETGWAAENTYSNSNGDPVEWRLTQVMTLDQLPPGELFGKEVFSYRVAPEADDTDPERLDPASRPTAQSGI